MRFNVGRVFNLNNPGSHRRAEKRRRRRRRMRRRFNVGRVPVLNNPPAVSVQSPLPDARLRCEHVTLRATPVP